jgi:putative transposase
MMVWCIVGMALERKEPSSDRQPSGHHAAGQSSLRRPQRVIQARQRLGSEAVRRVFSQTAQLWHNATPHPHWCGLTLLAIDGVFWRTPDTPENDIAFPARRMAETRHSTHRLKWSARWS